MSDKIVEALNKKAKEKGAEIKWLQEPYDEEHLDVLWYGGRICIVEHKGWKFIIGAYGDVDVVMYDRVTGDEIVSVKDKYNSGRFYDEFSYYIKNDKELASLSEGLDEKRELVTNNNNWFEVLADAPDGEYFDTGWVTADFEYVKAVEEVLDVMDDAIRQWTEE